LADPLESIDHRRLEVIMTGAIRTQVRLNAAGIKKPQGEEFSRICPHCNLELEETAQHILWECALSSELRAATKLSLNQAILASPARAGIPDDWNEWPGPLRAFGILGLDTDIVESVKNLPNASTYGPRHLIPIDYVQLALWRSRDQTPRRRIAKTPRFRGNLPPNIGIRISQFLGDFIWQEDYVHVYTDGSCHHQQFPWLRRSGAGVFWGDAHPLNASTNQAGQAHTSPRAELLAIVIAIEQSRWPIHIFLIIKVT
jgi:hypothetical protein